MPASPSEPSPRLPGRPERPRPGGPGRVLILEDDQALRELLVFFLGENGYEVVAVANGEEGLREAAAAPFGAILCDLQMPVLGGKGFYRELARIQPGIGARIVFMTGYRAGAQLDDFIAASGGMLLLKPFSLHKLLEIFEALQCAPASPPQAPKPVWPCES